MNLIWKVDQFIKILISKKKEFPPTLSFKNKKKTSTDIPKGVFAGL